MKRILVQYHRYWYYPTLGTLTLHVLFPIHTRSVFEMQCNRLFEQSRTNYPVMALPQMVAVLRECYQVCCFVRRA